jgi:hypothetical protein
MNPKALSKNTPRLVLKPQGDGTIANKKRPSKAE